MEINIITYFKNLSDDELNYIVKDIIKVNEKGHIGRVESLVPYAEAFTKAIGGDVFLVNGLDDGEKKALLEFARRKC